MRIIILLLITVLSPLGTWAQIKEPTQFTFGAGYNFMGLIFRSDQTQTKSSPLFNAGADYFLGNQVSLGPVFSFQRLSITDNSSSSPPGQAPFVSLNRISPGMRALLWHKTDIGHDGRFVFSIFMGFRLSYERIEMGKSNLTLASGYSKQDFTYQRFTRQLQIGGKLKFKKKWGIFGELGLGAPYFFQTGIFIQ